MAPKRLNPRVFISLWPALVSILILVPYNVYAKGKAESDSQLPDFNQFVLNVQNGQADEIRGIYVPELMAYRVVQQPDGNPGFVSSYKSVVTEFDLSRDFGNIGLIAHNYLAGQSYSSLTVGNEIRVIYGDGRVEYFTVTQILRYQALQPANPYSDFLDIRTGEKISARSLFDLVYSGPRHLTFQTCITESNDILWGRLFVIALPAVNVLNGNGQFLPSSVAGFDSQIPRR